MCRHIDRSENGRSGFSRAPQSHASIPKPAENHHHKQRNAATQEQELDEHSLNVGHSTRY